jgi:hypothetical protein
MPPAEWGDREKWEHPTSGADRRSLRTLSPSLQKKKGIDDGAGRLYARAAALFFCGDRLPSDLRTNLAAGVSGGGT